MYLKEQDQLKRVLFKKAQEIDMNMSGINGDFYLV
jgi:hypothetical protein